MNASLILGLVGLIAVPWVNAEPAPPARTFDFTYAATITGLRPSQRAQIWLPVPASDREQDGKLVTQELPGSHRFTQEARFGNHLAYIEASADRDGRIPLRLVYKVTRRETGEQADGQDASAWLTADTLVPVGGKAVELLRGKELPRDSMQLARLLYNIVDDHLQYRKDKPGWGRGDSEWACQSGFGNCTDFHSLFIALARSQKVPARFEIGFAIPAEHGSGKVAGYHCWARCKPAGHGWVPVDISEANVEPARRDYLFGHLDENRVMFSIGRDLILEPKQSGPPVNFLVYPYVEIDGQPWPADRIERAFSWVDVEPEK